MKALQCLVLAQTVTDHACTKDETHIFALSHLANYIQMKPQCGCPDATYVWMPHPVCRISKCVLSNNVFTTGFLHQWCGKQGFDRPDQLYSFGTDSIGSEMNLLKLLLDPYGLKKKHIEWVPANYSHCTNLGECQLWPTGHDFDDWTTLEFILLGNMNYKQWTDESTAK